jgi:hypothetical protein
MAIESLLTISRDENERARLLTQEKNLTDWQAGITYARREGIKIGQQQSAATIEKQQGQLAAQAAEIADLKRQLAQARPQ